jgi:uncharacterized protein (TIGR00266 family)
MQIELLHQPGSAVAKINLDAGETCVSEGGAMIAMSPHLDLVTSTHKKNKGSLMASLKRMLVGESMFINHFTATGKAGELYLSSSLPGDMLVSELAKGENLIVQGGSFVACSEEVQINFGWEGFKSFFSGEGLFWLNLQGPGQALINSFGAIYPVEVNGETIVDTGHIVAFNETLSFEITKAGSSWFSSFLGGEGLVCKFKGKGTVWCQSHHPRRFGRLLGPRLRAR